MTTHIFTQWQSQGLGTIIYRRWRGLDPEWCWRLYTFRHIGNGCSAVATKAFERSSFQMTEFDCKMVAILTRTEFELKYVHDKASAAILKASGKNWPSALPRKDVFFPEKVSGLGAFHLRSEFERT